MKTLKLFSLACCAGAAVGAGIHIADAQTGRDGIVRDALQRGAHQVVCQNNRCQDQVTMEYLEHKGDAPDGTYLVYPDTPDNASSIARTRDDVKALEK